MAYKVLKLVYELKRVGLKTVQFRNHDQIQDPSQQIIVFLNFDVLLLATV